MSNEFKYTREWTDEGAFPLLGFTKNWENPADYPTYEPDEMQVRKDMQSLHDEVKDFLNNELIPRVVAEDATVEAWTYAEEQRAANEVTRVANEEQRVANEAARVAAESGRTAAEQARALAEQGRVDSTTGIVAQATEQARAASASAGYAADSASAASASAAEATQQAGTAFTWSSHAEQAANHAAAAANGADDSRIRAEESAGQAAASASSAARSESEAKRYAEQASSAGSGDMLQSVYDPTGKRQDVFKYVDNKVSNIPTPDVSGQISAHNSSSSAHADIRTALDGKAPAGYGLGGGGANCADCNSATANGWYTCAGAANAPAATNYGWMVVSSRSGAGGMIRQDYYTAQSTPVHFVRYCVNGTWRDWVSADGAAKIVTGSYKGTGTSGSGSPNSLTFNFKPKFVIMTAQYTGTSWSTLFGNNSSGGCFFVDASILTSDYKPGLGFCFENYSVPSGAKMVDNTLSWYASSASAQLNTSSFTYYYMAIG